jgi:hypothetical protein|tara:strand:- start:666 stop:998 length:333 start_codon:yes stop_codon:yes gene_type:complete
MENFHKPEIVLESENVLVSSQGRPLEEDTSETIFAKYNYEKTESKQSKKHYVLTYNNDLYDPLGPDSHRQQRLNLKLKQVSQNTFDYYCKYLQTKNQMYLTKSKRSFIHG